ncbi:MAG: hypothetical protein O2809_04685 [Proteobacteria bacterium]|nr:hypothetical protein [Pseudomonadota bacterium]
MPEVQHRTNDSISLQAEFALKASLMAIKKAKIDPQDIDAIIVSCSNFQRAYPSIAAELQAALGIEKAYAFDMNSGCASAVFGIGMANALIMSGMADRVLVATPELYSFHVNFKDRKSHFIFGDGSSAVVIERKTTQAKQALRIDSVKLASSFSNNIRNNFGFINFAEDQAFNGDDKKFMQNGRQVREEVVPMVIHHLNKHIPTW